MLANNKNKKENIKKRKKNDLELYEDNIQSMRSWVRKIEQSANSISSRLSTVEKRISLNKGEGNIVTVDTSVNRSISKALADIQNIDDNNFEELVKILSNELVLIREELLSQQNEISLFNEKIDDLNYSLDKTKEEISKNQDFEEKILKDVDERVTKIENRAPPTMKLGKMEVPIEIAGVISGGIAIFAALLMFMNQKSILVSPVFLGLVGVLFITAALLKSVRSSKKSTRQSYHTTYRETLSDQ